MKLNELEQKAVDHIRHNATRYGTSGGGMFDNPKTHEDKRTRKLLDNGVILYVGCGSRTESGWMGGAGLIPADMFDATKHTKLSVDRDSSLKVVEQKCNNSLAMVYHVVLDGITIAECRDPYWANYLAKAIKGNRYT